MPFVYVRGFLSHAGKVFEGLNPVSVLSEIVTRTETCMDFADVAFGEAAPPPTWLYMKDGKDRYDVSMPLSAQGCFSVLTLKQTPAELLGRVERVCRTSFDAVLARMNEGYARQAFGQEYATEYFYTGICDLSYINIDDPAAQRASVAEAMPLFGRYYDVPFEAVKAVSMAGINIGPWGKDFHKLTERVSKEDLYARTPRILDAAVCDLLKD